MTEASSSLTGSAKSTASAGSGAERSFNVVRAPTPVHQLPAGTKLSAEVIHQSPEGRTTLQTPEGRVEVQTSRLPLPPGTKVEVEIRPQGAELQVRIRPPATSSQPQAQPPAVQSGTGSTGTAPQQSPTPAFPAKSPSTPSQSGSLPPSPNPGPAGAASSPPPAQVGAVIKGTLLPAPPVSTASVTANPQTPLTPEGPALAKSALPSSGGAAAPTAQTAPQPAPQNPPVSQPLPSSGQGQGTPPQGGGAPTQISVQPPAQPAPSSPSPLSAPPAPQGAPQTQSPPSQSALPPASSAAAGSGTQPAPSSSTSSTQSALPPNTAPTASPPSQPQSVEVRIIQVQASQPPQASQASQSSQSSQPSNPVQQQTPPPAASPTSVSAPTPPTAPPVPTVTGAVTGTVVGTTGQGEMVVSTPRGLLSLPVSTSLPPQTTVKMEILSSQPLTSAAALSDGRPTPLSTLLREWPNLHRAIQLFMANPQAMAQATPPLVLARPDTFTAAILILMNAFKGGDMTRWLGEGGHEKLEKALGRSLTDALTHDFDELSRQSQSDGDDWKVYYLPLADEETMRQVRFAWHQFSGAETETEDDLDKRFLLDVTLSRTGRLQIDGLIHQQRFDLTLRCETEFPKYQQAQIQKIYDAAKSTAGLMGQLAITVTREFVELPVVDTISVNMGA